MFPPLCGHMAENIAFRVVYNQKMCVCVYHIYICICNLSAALLSATAVNYILSLISLVMFYVYYTHSDGCAENKTFISINMLLCVGASVMSVLPKIQVIFSAAFLGPGVGCQEMPTVDF